MNDIKTTFVGDGYIVSIDDVWVEGVYESKKDAELACKINPEITHQLWRESQGNVITLKDKGVINEG
jgi:hypothetical protein